MHIAVTARRILARHPWVYWLACVLLALGVAVLVNERLAALDATRSQWGTTRRVFVALTEHLPGDPLRAESRSLPRALVPPDAAGAIAPDQIVRQRVTVGEVIVTADLVAPDGPAVLADDGTMVIGVVDPLAPGVRIGLRVRVVAEGVVLADDARVVALADDVVFVAVEADAAPMVAAAAHDGTASLVFVP